MVGSQLPSLFSQRENQIAIYTKIRSEFMTATVIRDENVFGVLAARFRGAERDRRRLVKVAELENTPPKKAA